MIITGLRLCRTDGTRRGLCPVGAMKGKTMLSGIKSPFQGMPLPQCVQDACEYQNICCGDEAALRHFTYNRNDIPPMTPEQREWCLAEIKSVEGYDVAGLDRCTDMLLAKTVLHAWADYARDKGLM